LLELGQGVLDVPLAALQVGATVVDLGQQVAQLTGLAGLLVVHVDDRADLLEREADPAAAHDQREADAVAAVVDPLRAATLGGDQPELLVVAHSAVGDAELLGDRKSTRLNSSHVKSSY